MKRRFTTQTAINNALKESKKIDLIEIAKLFDFSVKGEKEAKKAIKKNMIERGLTFKEIIKEYRELNLYVLNEKVLIGYFDF